MNKYLIVLFLSFIEGSLRKANTELLFKSISQNIQGKKLRYKPCLLNSRTACYRCAQKVFIEVFLDLLCKPIYYVNQLYRTLLPKAKFCSDYCKNFEFDTKVVKFNAKSCSKYLKIHEKTPAMVSFLEVNSQAIPANTLKKVFIAGIF